MDETPIRTFAQERGLTYRWKTWAEGDRSFAAIEVKKAGETIYTVQNNCLSGEQYVLDNVMAWAIEDISAGVKHDVIVAFGPRGKVSSP